MYNWRLLLLAFVAVFQPIASFNARNLVDGRQQCCDHRIERDTAYSLYGNSYLKQPSEDRYTTGQRREIREVRRDERRHENVALSRLAIDSLRDSKERENRRSLEFGRRSSRTESQRERETYAQDRIRVVSDNRARNTREELRDTRTDRIRIEPIRLHVSRDNLKTSRAQPINRDSSYRTKRDVRDIESRQEERRATNSQRDTSLMKTNIDEVRDTRETRVELRRARDSFDRSVKYDRRIKNDESLERRVLESRIERDQRNVRSLDRFSRDSGETRRESIQRVVRMVDDERKARVQSRQYFRRESEGRSIDRRVREREEYDRRMTSRSTMTPQRLDSRDRRSLSRSIRRENEFRVTPNFGDRAYEVDELRNNVRNGLTYRSERRIARERNDYERRSSTLSRLFTDRARERTEERDLAAERRPVSQIRNIREETRKQSRTDFRSASLENRRVRQISRRFTLSATRLTENRADRALDMLEREINEYRRMSTSDRSAKRTRDSRELSREDSRDRRESRITDTRRSHITNNDMTRDENKTPRERIQRFRERFTSEQRPARENQRKIESARNYRAKEETQRNIISERQFREQATSESNRVSSRANSRDARERYSVRDNERRETRNVDRARDTSRDVSRRHIELQTRADVVSARNVAKLGQKNDATENQTNEYNWHYLIYTLQGIYLCSIFMPIILAKNYNHKQTKNFGWWTPFQNAMKMD